jgi:hypothetical protein
MKNGVHCSRVTNLAQRFYSHPSHLRCLITE